MTSRSTFEIAQELFDRVEILAPRFLKVPEDLAIARGNLVMLLLDDRGGLFGRHVGGDPVRQRESALVAMRKIEQVRLTRTATATYERQVWSGSKRLPLRAHGTLDWSVALSGLRGEQDVELLLDAVDGIAEVEVISE